MPSNRKRHLKWLIVPLSIFFLIRKNFGPANILPQTITFEIDKGESPTQFTKQLCKDLNIGKLKCRIWMAKVRGENPQIKPGKYIFDLTGAQPATKVFEKIIELAIKGPKQTYTKFTILEGWSKFDIEQKLIQTSGTGIAQQFLELIDDPQYTKDILKEYKLFKDFKKPLSLEGFLYPDTYFFRPQDLSSSLFPQLLTKTSIKEFAKHREKLQTKCKKDPLCNPYKLPPYQTLIFASIIEKEEKNPANKPLVADILLRRRQNGWKIEADWTLCYGLKLPSNECQNYLRNKYLKDNTNIYNTRANKGIPPTPVGNPSKESIEAVLRPQKNAYWFYLHDSQGNIHFAKTLQQHNENKKIYLK